MKTITISIDDETYRRYQHRAEAVGASLEAWAAARLEEATPKRTSKAKADAEKARRQRQEIIECIRSEYPGFSAADRLPREDLYDRNASR